MGARGIEAILLYSLINPDSENIDKKQILLVIPTVG
jgi:hypothetical protein